MKYQITFEVTEAGKTRTILHNQTDEVEVAIRRVKGLRSEGLHAAAVEIRTGKVVY